MIFFGHVVFGYGMLMNPAVVADRCQTFRYLGRASLLDFKYAICRRGVATILPVPDAIVFGTLWEVDQNDLIALDYFEGVGAGHYRRRRMEVTDDLGQVWRASVYIARDDIPGRARDGYQEAVVRAASIHAFPESYIRELSGWVPTADV